LYFDKTTKGKKRFRPEGKVNSKDVAELRKLKSSIISVDAMEREENVGKKFPSLSPFRQWQKERVGSESESRCSQAHTRRSAKEVLGEANNM
jgi:hypothetical protein